MEELVIFTVPLSSLFLCVFSVFSICLQPLALSLLPVVFLQPWPSLCISVFLSLRQHSPILCMNVWLLWNPVCMVVVEGRTVCVESSVVPVRCAGGFHCGF